MVVNAGKAAVVEPKCSPRELAPESDPALERRQRRGVYYPSEQLRIATAGILPLINGRSGGATYAKSRPGALRMLRPHNPNNLGADCSRMQQQEHTAQHTKSSTIPPDSHGVYLTRNYALGISCGDFCR
jgi:hypothetical protein